MENGFNCSSLDIFLLGSLEYEEALELQENLFEKRLNDKVNDTLLILEHPSVITIGRGGSANNVIASQEELEKRKIKIIETNRGGDVTYHGPGQIVGYYIADLSLQERDIKIFVWKMENFIINLLRDNFNIIAERKDQLRGVWIGNSKIAAMGFYVKRWITMHGFALNVNIDLDGFDLIVPCGIKDKSVTSLNKIIGEEVNFSDIRNLVIKYFSKEFKYEKVNFGMF
jgi:lipoyl(octanoyl) transferase